MQTENAKERLVATFVEQSDLGVGDGGKATTQDLIRMLLCARVACSLDSKRAEKLADDNSSGPLHPGVLTCFYILAEPFVKGLTPPQQEQHNCGNDRGVLAVLTKGACLAAVLN